MNQKINIADIARDLNISKTTVSYVINGKAKQARISAQLEQRVLTYIEKIQYIPNHMAQSLRTGKTNLIGLIVDDISNNFYSEIARHMEEISFPLGYRLLYCSSENKLAKFKELINLFKERRVDAYVITPVQGSEEDIKTILNRNEKLVLFDRYYKSLNSNYVIIDNEKSAYGAVKLLISKGRSKIGFVTLLSSQTVMEDRKAGYVKAITEANLEPFIEEVRFSTRALSYVNQITSMLKSNPSLDALLFSSSVLGIAGLEALKSASLKIPDEICVISFDDHILFRMYSPAITVVAQPTRLLAKKLLEIILGEQMQTPQAAVIPAVLKIRESS